EGDHNPITDVPRNDIAGTGSCPAEGDEGITPIPRRGEADAVLEIAERGIAGRVHADEIALNRDVALETRTRLFGTDAEVITRDHVARADIAVQESVVRIRTADDRARGDLDGDADASVPYS